MFKNVHLFEYLFCPKNSSVVVEKLSLLENALLSKALLDYIFNALSIGLQYSFLFQWPDSKYWYYNLKIQYEILLCFTCFHFCFCVYISNMLQDIMMFMCLLAIGSE